MSFQKIDIENETRLDEQYCVLVVGYTNEELNILIPFIESSNIPEYLIIPKEKFGLSVETLLQGTEEVKEFDGAIVPKALIMSGFTQKEIHNFVQNYKSLSLPMPLFAVVTPTSKKWKLGKLLKELALERAKMSKSYPK